MSTKDKIRLSCSFIAIIFLSIPSFSLEKISTEDSKLLLGFFEGFYRVERCQSPRTSPKSPGDFFLTELIINCQMNNIITNKEQIDLCIADMLLRIKEYLSKDQDIKILDDFIAELSLHYFFSKEKEKMIEQDHFIHTIGSVLRVTAQQMQIVPKDDLVKLDNLFTKFFNYIIKDGVLKNLPAINNKYEENKNLFGIKGSHFKLKKIKVEFNLIDEVVIFFNDETKIKIDMAGNNLLKGLINFEQEIKKIKLKNSTGKANYLNFAKKDISKEGKEIIVSLIFAAIRHEKVAKMPRRNLSRELLWSWR